MVPHNVLPKIRFHFSVQWKRQNVQATNVKPKRRMTVNVRFRSELDASVCVTVTAWKMVHFQMDEECVRNQQILKDIRIASTWHTPLYTSASIISTNAHGRRHVLTKRFQGSHPHGTCRKSREHSRTAEIVYQLSRKRARAEPVSSAFAVVIGPHWQRHVDKRDVSE